MVTLSRHKDWDSQILDFVRREKEPISRSLFMFPVGSERRNRSAVMLIGDAARVMSFAGEDLYFGLQDALNGCYFGLLLMHLVFLGRRTVCPSN